MQRQTATLLGNQPHRGHEMAPLSKTVPLAASPWRPMRSCGGMDERILRCKDTRAPLVGSLCRAAAVIIGLLRQTTSTSTLSDLGHSAPKPTARREKSCRNELSLRSVRLGLARLAHELLKGLGIDVVDAEEARDAFREVAAVPRLEHALLTERPPPSSEVEGRRSGVSGMCGAVVSAVDYLDHGWLGLGLGVRGRREQVIGVQR